MAIINPPKISKKEVSQRFNLKELLGYEPTEEQKKLFFELVVDKIVQRTASGKDINNSKFTRYSEAYAEKKGVSRSSVDMILTGEMLSSFEESQTQKNIVKIKIQDGEQTLKAFNHNFGDTLPKREFFGINENDSLRSIRSEVNKLRPSASERVRESAINLADLRRAIQSTIDVNIEGLDGES